MINSILTVVNNITTYATNNSDVFKLALALAILGTIIFAVWMTIYILYWLHSYWFSLVLV